MEQWTAKAYLAVSREMMFDALTRMFCWIAILEAMIAFWGVVFMALGIPVGD